jgi:hypothetical protein
MSGVLQAMQQYSHTSGAPWVFSDCQGAAGSEYCTWVRPAENAVVKVDDVSVPHAVDSFQWHSLQPIDIADAFVTAWQFGNSDAEKALGSSAAVSQIEALAAHRHDPWQSPAACQGVAGSMECVFLNGHHQLIVRVSDVTTPKQVAEVTYKA